MLNETLAKNGSKACRTFTRSKMKAGVSERKSRTEYRVNFIKV